MGQRLWAKQSRSRALDICRCWGKETERSALWLFGGETRAVWIRESRRQKSEHAVDGAVRQSLTREELKHSPQVSPGAAKEFMAHSVRC